MAELFAALLEPFAENRPLYARVRRVLEALPAAVREDLLTDPQFSMAVDDYAPGRGRRVWLGTLAGNGQSRCVVLKPSLAERPDAFACYVIAHELAHAFLRNGGWGDIRDPEAAADALAASWGFARPKKWLGLFR